MATLNDLADAITGRYSQAIARPPRGGGQNDNATLADAVATGKRLQPGTYILTQSIDASAIDRPALLGAAAGQTEIQMSPGVYLIDGVANWHTLTVRDILTYGGAGIVRNQSTGTDVIGIKLIEDCWFFDYTHAAISSNCSDDPNWTIRNNMFRGANYTTAIGIALGGLMDSDRIEGNKFSRNKIHIKCGAGGCNTYIHHNDFIFMEADAGPRVTIWIVPNQARPENGNNAWVNPGNGLVIAANKFGPEGAALTDYPILYADEGAGTLIADRMPVFTDSVGVIANHTIRDNDWVTQTATPKQFIYTTTAEMYGCNFSGHVFNVQTGMTFFKWKNPPTWQPKNCVVGHVTFSSGQGMPLSNSPRVRCINSVQTVDRSAGETTVPAYNVDLIRFMNSAATTVTNFTSGSDGIDLKVISLNGNTTIANTGNVSMAANLALAANTMYRFTYFDGKWYRS